MLAHRLAKLSALSTFLLLIIGGTVNPTGSSLACPEPTLLCHGQLFPPMVGGVFYEHGHRLAAMLVGAFQLALTWALLRQRPQRTRLAWLGLGLVLLQGTLGAITVKYKLPWFVSSAHLLTGMSYFALMVYIAFQTRRPATADELAAHARGRADLGDARRWIAIAGGAVLVQLLLGALVRHGGAAMVCLGMPQCTRGGDWWPATGVQHLHMLHRAAGVLVGVVTIIAAISVARRARAWPSLRALMLAAPVLVIAQITLGIATVLTLRSVPVAVAHFAGATALWGLWVSAWLITAPRAAASSAPAVARAPGGLADVTAAGAR
ncbi:MAG: COX15/CtaA family protein [Kofleriaceae bacterium]